MAAVSEPKPPSGKSPAEIEQSCKRFLRAWVIGEQGEHPTVGVRRQTPLPQLVTDTEEYPSQQPLPELDGVEVTDADGNPAVLADLIPLESVGVTREGTTIRLEFCYCRDYPPERLGKPPGRRVLVAPDDPRLWLWTIQCLDVLYASLGDTTGVTFDVDLHTDRFEALLADEKTLPG